MLLQAEKLAKKRADAKDDFEMLLSLDVERATPKVRLRRRVLAQVNALLAAADGPTTRRAAYTSVLSGIIGDYRALVGREGVTDRTVLQWMAKWDKRWRSGGGLVTVRQVPEHALLDDDGVRKEMAAFVVGALSKKQGQRVCVFTVKDFHAYVVQTFAARLPLGKLSEETARVWLHKLGFAVNKNRAVSYCDGHERQDVVLYRAQYVAKLLALWPRVVKNVDATNLLAGGNGARFTAEEQALLGCELADGEDGQQQRPVVLLFHDESTFYANDFHRNQRWHEEGTPAVGMKTKSLGSAVMVSAWLSRAGGMEFWEKHEHTTQGYWTAEHMKTHWDKLRRERVALRYQRAECWFVLDNSSNHTKMAPDALNADRLNVKDGGERKDDLMQFRDGWVEVDTPTGKRREPFPMMFTNAKGERVCKGLMRILTERGVNINKGRGKMLSRDEMVALLKTHPDFAEARPQLQEQIESASPHYRVIFLPKFHCELNPIELAWCTVKRTLRKTLDGKVGTLRAQVEAEIQAIPPEWVHKWDDHVLHYLEGYGANNKTSDVFNYVKNKSHRRAKVKNALIDVDALAAHWHDPAADGGTSVRVCKRWGLGERGKGLCALTCAWAICARHDVCVCPLYEGQSRRRKMMKTLTLMLTKAWKPGQRGVKPAKTTMSRARSRRGG